MRVTAFRERLRRPDCCRWAGSTLVERRHLAETTESANQGVENRELSG